MKFIGEVLSGRTIQVQHANFKTTNNQIGDGSTPVEHYIGLQESEENTNATSAYLPLVAPASGKLLRVYYRHQLSDHTGDTHVFRLKTTNTSVSTGTAPTTIGKMSLVQASASQKILHTLNWSDTGTGSTQNMLEDGSAAGSNVINQGDMVFVSIASEGAAGITKWYFAFVFEWDFSAI